ncbi:hypothetical protein [Burkholderia sp. PAMC 26561]|uniref:hypothetical protein n=1 Tax=Burkholderia sp. PAMC 26561 TaxID=1795043 RepID=UPI00076B18A0|nr:hypothetical protein [Burkholderia sp. PAMC 26561]AME23743.1 S1/P1 Nuclease [Burkholderia sp. PAMC 26561]
MDLLSNQLNFKSLSMKDLLEARDAYHWHLMNKANVVATAVGLYLIRKSEPWPNEGFAPAASSRAKDARTFSNSEVRRYSWPCVIVLVRDWIESTEFGHNGVDPDRMVPRTLYLPDGRSVPVCVVAVEPATAHLAKPADTRWPRTYIGGGCPIVADVQGQQHTASVGCLVTDGHTTYALTNRHVCGLPGERISARVRGELKEVGRASEKQITREAFASVFPALPSARTYLTLDVGLIEVDDVNDWTSQPFGLLNPVGDIADLNELNLGLQLIDQPVAAFGAASGALSGTIKALFYRHKSIGGYDFISEFLIAPEDGAVQTLPGDSGTVWHLQTVANGKETILRPMAVEWGGQALVGNDRERFNYALATGLGTVCQLLDVDLIQGHNTGANPFWGQTGHYSIATAAIDHVKNEKLKAFLTANVERISFPPDQPSPGQIRKALANGDFVELADVPDLVWKKVKNKVPGGRDYAQNAGPEHPNHYADIDKPDANGTTLRDLSLESTNNMTVEVWQKWYEANGNTDARSQGLLPFRVWQLFDEMVLQLREGNISQFLCAAGIVSHYVGDACQPLHGSYLSDGYREQQQPGAKTWPGKGVHATYEDKMVDRYSSQLLAAIPTAGDNFPKLQSGITAGQSAATATVELMAAAATVISPKELCDEYIRLGGGSSARVVDGLWSAFGEKTAILMAGGALSLAALWDAAFKVAAVTWQEKPEAIDEKALATIYQDATFVPSHTLDKIGTVLLPIQAENQK